MLQKSSEVRPRHVIAAEAKDIDVEIEVQTASGAEFSACLRVHLEPCQFGYEIESYNVRKRRPYLGEPSERGWVLRAELIGDGAGMLLRKEHADALMAKYDAAIRGEIARQLEGKL